MVCIFEQLPAQFDGLRIFFHGAEVVEIGILGFPTIYSRCLHPGYEVGKQYVRFLYVNVGGEYGLVLLRAKGDGRGGSVTGFGVGTYVTLHFYSQLVV